MKKLLITTLAAVSVGLCAKADDTGVISETSFEGLTTGGDFEIDNDYWQTQGDTEDQFKIIDVEYSETATQQHWDLATEEKALSIDTANPILRNVNPEDGETGENTAQNVSPTPVFFDSVVQFTATDVAPSMENNTTDKLAVWLYSTPEDAEGRLFGEDDAVTNLVITAGYYDGNTLKTTNYFTNVAIEPDTWHRLTIKSFKNNNSDLVFNIWVDKTQVAVDGATDFLSRISDKVSTNIPYDQLQGVAFDGKGAVDDIVFTTTAPEFAKEATYAIAATFNNDDVAIAYFEDEDGYTELPDASKIDIETKTVYVFIEMKDDAELTGVKLNGVSVAIPNMEDGGYNILLPLGTPVSGTTYELVISTTSGGGSGVTVGGTAVEFDNDGMIANITTAFNGKDVSGKLDTTKFKSYYTANVENGILSIKLDQKAAAPFAEATEEKEVLEVGEDASGNPVLTVRIKPYVGLYYGAMTGSALDNLTLTAAGYQEAKTDEVIEFTATGKAGDTAGFIKVVVTDIAPESTEE